MEIAEKKSNAICYTLAAAAFFLPVFQNASLALLVIAFLISLFSGEKLSDGWTMLRTSFFYKASVALYLIYLSGMLWTDHYDLGWEDLGVKIPLLIFPVIFSFVNLNGSRRYVENSLIAGSIVSVIICFVLSLKVYLKDHDIQNFYYTGFSHVMHPTYYTMYLNLCVLLLLNKWIHGRLNGMPQKAVAAALIFIFLTVIITLSARLAMLAAMTTILFFLFFEIKKTKSIRRHLPQVLIAAVILAFWFWKLVQINNRFIQIADVIEHKKDVTAVVDTATNVSYNSTTIRIGLLKNSLEVFSKHPLLGVGTGDFRPETAENLERKGLHFLAVKNYSAHNQYVQTATTVGVFALIILILVIVVPAWRYFRAGEFLFTAFMLIVFFNAAGDTVLRASSLLLFMFFGCYFNKLFINRQTEKE